MHITLTPAQAFGRAIVLVRTLQGCDRKGLALDAGVSYPYLSEIEVGRKEPSAEVVRKLAYVLMVTVASLHKLAERIERGENVLGMEVAA